MVYNTLLLYTRDVYSPQCRCCQKQRPACFFCGRAAFHMAHLQLDDLEVKYVREAITLEVCNISSEVTMNDVMISGNPNTV